MVFSSDDELIEALTAVQQDLFRVYIKGTKFMMDLHLSPVTVYHEIK